MRQKNLGRMLSGEGQSGSAQTARLHSHRTARTEVRALLRSTLAHIRCVNGVAEEWPLEAAHDLRLRKTQRECSNRWAVINRWLESRTSEPWSEVYQDLLQRFRAQRGRARFVLEFLLRWNVDTNEEGYNTFFVDSEGALRSRKSPRRHRWTTLEDEESASEALRQWAGERRVRRVGGQLFWCLPAHRGEFCIQPSAWRQDRRLSPEEERFYLSFHESIRCGTVDQ